MEEPERKQIVDKIIKQHHQEIKKSKTYWIIYEMNQLLSIYIYFAQFKTEGLGIRLED